MKAFKTLIGPILAATIWISLSEFVRNEFLLKEAWVNHYASLGLDFPDAPVNGALWGIWSLLYAVSIFAISRRFSMSQTVILSWFIGFVLMWVVIGNLGVLPLSILPYALPLSILEAYLASLIIIKWSPPD